MRCETCEEEKVDVEWTTDPYQEEINGVQDWSWMCGECYQISAWEI